MLVAVCSCFGLAATVQAESVPLTPELLVSDSASAPNAYSRLALGRSGDGTVLVAWTVINGEGTQTSLYLRRYDAQGRPQSAPCKLADATEINGIAVAMNAAGSAVVAWSTRSFPLQPLTGNTVVHAQRYDSAGTAMGSEIDIARLKGVASVDVAMDKSGGFALSWGYSVGLFGLYGYSLYQNAVHVGVYGADGRPRIPDLLVNDPAHTLGGKPYVTASVAMDDDGDFAVAWDAARGYLRAQSPTRGAVLMRRYSRFGLPGVEQQVDEFPRSRGLALMAVAPSLAMDAAGNISIGWVAAGMPVSRFYNANGAQAAPRFYPPINGAGYHATYASRIARAASGATLLSWSQSDDAYTYPSNGGSGMHAEAQAYAGDGTAIGAPFTIGTSMLSAPAVALDGNAAPAAAWITPGYEVHLQFYAAQ